MQNNLKKSRRLFAFVLSLGLVFILSLSVLMLGYFGANPDLSSTYTNSLAFSSQSTRADDGDNADLGGDGNPDDLQVYNPGRQLVIEDIQDQVFALADEELIVTVNYTVQNDYSANIGSVIWYIGIGENADANLSSFRPLNPSIEGAYRDTVKIPSSELSEGTIYLYALISARNVSNVALKDRSNAAKITITDGLASTPRFVTQPKSQQVDLNADISLDVEAVASGVLTYQWFKSTTSVITDARKIDGATDASFKPDTSEYGTTLYYVEATNTVSVDQDGNAIEPQTKTARSNVATVEVTNMINVPTIKELTTTAENNTVLVGDEYDITVVAEAASENAELSYQWYTSDQGYTSGGSAIFGANEATYSTVSEKTGTFYYYVVVTNTIDGKSYTATSDAMRIKVVEEMITPEVSIPEDQRVIVEEVNTEVVLKVNAEAPNGDNSTLTYQWYSNVLPNESGAEARKDETKSEIIVTQEAATATSYYYVVVTNTVNGKSKSVRSDYYSVTFVEKDTDGGVDENTPDTTTPGEGIDTNKDNVGFFGFGSTGESIVMTVVVAAGILLVAFSSAVLIINSKKKKANQNNYYNSRYNNRR